MEWWHFLIIIVSVLFLFLSTGYPIAFVFLTVNFGLFFFLLGGMAGVNMFVISIFDSIFTFTMVPVPMFILMGEILFRSGIAIKAIGALDNLLGKMPGRLSILATLSGIMFGAVSGSMMANTAMLGSTLAPEMYKKGYHKNMIFGPIMGVGGLAMLIPPSALAVLYASIARISVGEVLMAGVVPGIFLGLAYLLSIIIRVRLNPELAPVYDVSKVETKEKVSSLLLDVIPLGLVIFSVIGTIIIGFATPSEAAALGALSSFVLCALKKKFSFKLVKEVAYNTFKTSAMIFTIVAGTIGFGQMLAYTGIVPNVVQIASGLDIHPILIIVLMQIIIILLGFFLEVFPLMVITIPIMFPIVNLLGFDPIWFAVINLINLQMAAVTPPFGMLLFIMKGVAPKGTTIVEIYRSVTPFLLCDVTVMTIVLLVPHIALWLPRLVY